MSINPYAPPATAVADVDLSNPSDAADAMPPFFAVSLTKLVVLSLCSLGLYELYWFYMNWRLIRAREGSSVVPALRAFFAILFCYACFARIRDEGTKAGIASPLAAGALATGWIVTTMTWKLPDPYWLVSLLAVVFLVPVQAHANRVNAVMAPRHDRNERFSVGNWILAILGGGLFILAIIGTFMPDQ